MELKRTPAEIVARIAQIKGQDWMGTQQGDLINYLPFEQAKEHLKPDVTEAQWAEQARMSPLDAVKDYLPFAWGKANGCRGLSAGRSLDHIKAWLWLAGFGDLVEDHFQHYERYGKEQLVIASALCGFDWRAVDNGRWVNDESSPSLSDSRIEAISKECEAIARAALAKATEVTA